MHLKPLLLIFGLLAPVSVSLAGEGIPLDKDFSFRLDLTNPAPPSVAPSQPERDRSGTLKTPQGEPLPPGARKREFNGQSYYVIPLDA